MKQDERRDVIKRELTQHKKVEIEALSLRLGVSEMTVRRDLEFLERQGVLQRIAKGAILNPLEEIDPVDDTLSTRRLQNTESKKAIAKYAAQLVQDGDIIYMDASTTTYELCPYLAEKKLTIVTNSIRICSYFYTTKNITVILAGGMLRHGTLSLIGSDAEKLLRQYNTNKLFISGKALSADTGLTDINMFEINTKQAAMEKASEVIVLLDHTKLNKTSLVKICDLSRIAKIVIDGLKEFTAEELEILDTLKKYNVEIHIAPI